MTKMNENQTKQFFTSAEKKALDNNGIEVYATQMPGLLPEQVKFVNSFVIENELPFASRETAGQTGDFCSNAPAGRWVASKRMTAHHKSGGDSMLGVSRAAYSKIFRKFEGKIWAQFDVTRVTKGKDKETYGEYRTRGRKATAEFREVLGGCLEGLVAHWELVTHLQYLYDLIAEFKKTEQSTSSETSEKKAERLELREKIRSQANAFVRNFTHAWPEDTNKRPAGISFEGDGNKFRGHMLSGGNANYVLGDRSAEALRPGDFHDDLREWIKLERTKTMKLESDLSDSLAKKYKADPAKLDGIKEIINWYIKEVQHDEEYRAEAFMCKEQSERHLVLTEEEGNEGKGRKIYCYQSGDILEFFYYDDERETYFVYEQFEVEPDPKERHTATSLEEWVEEMFPNKSDRTRGHITQGIIGQLYAYEPMHWEVEVYEREISDPDDHSKKTTQYLFKHIDDKLKICYYPLKLNEDVRTLDFYDDAKAIYLKYVSESQLKLVTDKDCYRMVVGDCDGAFSFASLRLDKIDRLKIDKDNKTTNQKKLMRALSGGTIAEGEAWDSKSPEKSQDQAAKSIADVINEIININISRTSAEEFAKTITKSVKVVLDIVSGEAGLGPGFLQDPIAKLGRLPLSSVVHSDEASFILKAFTPIMQEPFPVYISIPNTTPTDSRTEENRVSVAHIKIENEKQFQAAIQLLVDRGYLPLLLAYGHAYVDKNGKVQLTKGENEYEKIYNSMQDLKGEQKDEISGMLVKLHQVARYARFILPVINKTMCNIGKDINSRNQQIVEALGVTKDSLVKDNMTRMKQISKSVTRLQDLFKSNSTALDGLDTQTRDNIKTNLGECLKPLQSALEEFSSDIKKDKADLEGKKKALTKQKAGSTKEKAARDSSINALGENIKRKKNQLKEISSTKESIDKLTECLIVRGYKSQESGRKPAERSFFSPITGAGPVGQQSITTMTSVAATRTTQRPDTGVPRPEEGGLSVTGKGYRGKV